MSFPSSVPGGARILGVMKCARALLLTVGALLVLALASAAYADQTGSGPVVATLPATATGDQCEGQQLVVTLNATVDPEGSDTSWYIEYGATPSYGQQTSTLDAGSGTAAVTVTSQPAYLTPLFHYRVVATNQYGTSAGADETATTITACPAEPAITPSEATPSDSSTAGGPVTATLPAQSMPEPKAATAEVSVRWKLVSVAHSEREVVVRYQSCAGGGAAVTQLHQREISLKLLVPDPSDAPTCTTGQARILSVRLPASLRSHKLTHAAPTA